MNKKYKKAIVKFNNGNGALLCNKCHIIIGYGFEHEDKIHFCDKCLYEDKKLKFGSNPF